MGKTPEIWLHAMARVRSELTSPGSAVGSARALQDALSDAEAALADALSRDNVPDRHGMIDELLDRASRLLIVTSDLYSTQRSQSVAREHTAAALTSQLAALEAAVLEGEATYQLDSSDALRPLEHGSHALKRLRNSARPTVGDQVALRTASAELAALLVRTAANLETTGQPQHGSAAASDTLLATITELLLTIARNADELSGDRWTTTPEDHIGRRLCESLRVPVDLASLDALRQHPAEDAARHHALNAAQSAWRALAAREYAVASSLDAQLPDLHYKQRFGSVPNAIAAGAVNLLREGRLLLRPCAFRHRRAWGRQGIALSHAIQAYINGLRGNREAVAQAQLIVMSRLVRSVAALALINAQRQNLTSGNGRAQP